MLWMGRRNRCGLPPAGCTWQVIPWLGVHPPIWQWWSIMVNPTCLSLLHCGVNSLLFSPFTLSYLRHASAREGGRASKRASKREWKRHASTQQAAFATAGRETPQPKIRRILTFSSIIWNDNLKGRFIELGCFQSLITVSDSVQKAPPAPPAATVVRFIAVVPPALPENGSRGEEEEEGIPFCVDLCHPPIGSHSR